MIFTNSGWNSLKYNSPPKKKTNITLRDLGLERDYKNLYRLD